MIQASRVLNAALSSGERFPISIFLTQNDSDLAENEDGSTSEVFRGRVTISSQWINTHINIVAEDVFVLMYRAMWLTGVCISAEAERLNAKVFQQEPGDADGPLGLFTIG